MHMIYVLERRTGHEQSERSRRNEKDKHWVGQESRGGCWERCRTMCGYPPYIYPLHGAVATSIHVKGVLCRGTRVAGRKLERGVRERKNLPR